MSLLLAFDTATPDGSVALGRDGSRALARRIGTSVRHAEALLPAIAELLEEAGCRPADLDGIVVGSGPGSFTGVRIAAATARGMVRALGIDLYAFGSLQAEAVATGLAERPVCAVFDARRGEVYAACYEVGPEGVRTVLEPVASTLAELAGRLADRRVAWTGEAVRRQREAVPEAPVEPVMTRAEALLVLARRAPGAGLQALPSAWEPDYLRPPGAVRIER